MTISPRFPPSGPWPNRSQPVLYHVIRFGSHTEYSQAVGRKKQVRYRLYVGGCSGTCII